MTDMPNLDEFSAIPEGPGPIPKHKFDWKKSNGVKIGVAAALLLLTVLIFGLMLFSGGKNKNAAMNPAGGPSGTPDSGQTPPPPPPPAVSPPPSNETPAQPAGSPPRQETPNPAVSNIPGMPPQVTGTGELSEGPPRRNEGVEGYGAMAGGTPAAPENPPLPEDVTKWKKPDDYRRARKENHLKLAEALFNISKTAGRNEDSVKLFIELLKPIKVEPNPNDPPGAYAQPGAAASPQVIETLVNALAENGTKPAKEKLKSILTGDFPTDDDRAAVEAVMKTLLFNSSAENDALVMQLLTRPDMVRKAAPANPANPNMQMAMTPLDMRAKAQELVKLSASESLRIKLAEQYAKMGIDPNDPTLQFLLQEDPANLGAQLVLYRSEDVVGETRAKLEQYFQNYASQALCLTMGIPSGVEGMAMGSPSGSGPGYGGAMPGGERGYGPGPGYGGAMPGGERGYGPGYGPGTGLPTPEAPREKLTDLERGVKLANSLWSGPLIASLVEQLDDVRSMEKSAPAIVLASAFPVDSVRAAMYRMLKKRQLDGPQVLDAAGWADRVLNDPGTLVLVKMLNRKEQKTPKGASGRMPGYGPGAGYGPNPTGATTKAEAAARKLQTEYDWFDESKKLAGLWCSRFEAAAQAQHKAARRGTPIGEPAPEKLEDFEFPKEKDTKVEEAYQLNWPEKAPAGLAAAKPGTLKIRYFRITQTGTIKKSMTNLKRFMKGSEQHELENGLWAEVYSKPTAASAPRRTLDVIVNRLDKSPYDPTQREEPTEIEIHILSIEIADPGAAKE
jgi:hypothetical protein